MIAVFDHAAHYFFRRSSPQKLGGQQSASQNDLDPVVQRVAMVKHHLGHATGPKYTMHFAYGSCRIGRVMQNSVGVDHVEALVEKRQMLAVGNHERAVSVVELETMTCNLDRARRQIDTNAPCSVARKLQQVSAHTATNLEQLRPTKLFKFHHARHPR